MKNSFLKKEKAQASLEYLMSYGWALAIIVVIAAILFFLMSGATNAPAMFYSSDPAKIMVKAGNVSDTETEIQLQNITGGEIQVTGLAVENYTGCTINSIDPPTQVKAGNTMKINCTSSSNLGGKITINYTDFAGAQRNVSISSSKTTQMQLSPFCIDQYEASHFDAGSCSNSSAWGTCENDYGTSLTPASVSGRIPWVFISQTDAKAACSAAGKYLCSNSQWMAAANLNGNAYNLSDATTSSTCIVNSALSCASHSYADGDACNTGSASNCKSTEGVYDLIGNVEEWTANVIDADPSSLNNAFQYPTDSPAPGLWGNTVPSIKYGNDGVYTSINKTGVAIVRGGYYSDGSKAGFFYVNLRLLPSASNINSLGFRCCSAPISENTCNAGMAYIDPLTTTHGKFPEGTFPN